MQPTNDTIAVGGAANSWEANTIYRMCLVYTGGEMHTCTYVSRIMCMGVLCKLFLGIYVATQVNICGKINLCISLTN